MAKEKDTIKLSDLGEYKPKIGLHVPPIREGKKFSKEEIEEMHRRLRKAGLA